MTHLISGFYTKTREPELQNVSGLGICFLGFWTHYYTLLPHSHVDIPVSINILFKHIVVHNIVLVFFLTGQLQR